MKNFNSILLVCLLSIVSFTASSDTDFSYQTLEGINTVAIQVEGINKDLHRYGFDPASLNKSIEHELSNAGFKIISREEALRDETASLVKFSFHDIRSEYGFYTYTIDLEVKEKVPLPRRNNAFISTTIWNEGVHGMMMYHEVKKLQKGVNELLGSLITEHRYQNTVQK